MWLAGAVSVVLAALLGVAVRAAHRARVRVPVRWLAGAGMVLVVLACWVVTLVPQHVGDQGRITCIEEPLFGLTGDSQLSSPACIHANRQTVGLSVAGAVAVVAVGGVALRTVGRRARS